MSACIANDLDPCRLDVLRDVIASECVFSPPNGILADHELSELAQTHRCTGVLYDEFRHRHQAMLCDCVRIQFGGHEEARDSLLGENLDDPHHEDRLGIAEWKARCELI